MGYYVDNDNKKGGFKIGAIEIPHECASKTGISSYGANLINTVQYTATNTPKFKAKLKLCKNDYDVFNLIFNEENTINKSDIETAIKYRDEHKQVCPQCNKSLDVFTNYVGGGSHYWHLYCMDCQQEYQYDTYRFCLEAFESEN